MAAPGSPLNASFPVGLPFATANAPWQIAFENVLPGLTRNDRRDWGAAREDDRKANKDALGLAP